MSILLRGGGAVRPRRLPVPARRGTQWAGLAGFAAALMLSSTAWADTIQAVTLAPVADASWTDPLGSTNYDGLLYGTSTTWNVGRTNSGTRTTRRGVMQFDLSAIQDAAEVQSAVLSLYLDGLTLPTSGTEVRLQLFRSATDDWTESSLPPQSPGDPPYNGDAFALSQLLFEAPQPAGGWKAGWTTWNLQPGQSGGWDPTADLLDGKLTLVLKMWNNNSEETTTSTLRSFNFRGREYANADYRPALTITARIPSAAPEPGTLALLVAATGAGWFGRARRRWT